MNGKGRDALMDVLACMLLIMLVLGVFVQTAGFEFLDYDDGSIVAGHPVVSKGLTGEGLVWAVTHYHFGMYMPVTSLSHMLDVALFGLWPGGHHLVSVLIHALCALFAYLAFHALTGERGRSYLAAAFFALHPLRANSVAWIASRKDLTSGLFFFLALIAYAYYVRKPRTGRYLLVAAAMILSLLSKPMIVTFPFVLLLLDWWPLRRFEDTAGAVWWKRAGRLVIEKVPLMAVAGVFAAVAFHAESAAGAIIPGESLSLAQRAGNAIVNYTLYLAHWLCPVNVAIHYPLRAHAAGQVLGAGLLLLAVTSFVLLLRRRRSLAVGWFWFLGMMAPVIGLVHVGSYALADRYTYLPTIGLGIVLAWSLGPAAGTPRGLGRMVRTAACVVLVLAALVLTWWQTGFWRDTRTVFTRAAAVTRDNALAHTKLGNIALEEKRLDEARRHFVEALRIEPRNPERYCSLGCVYAEEGDSDAALRCFRKAVELAPSHPAANYNLGCALLDQGAHSEAVSRLAVAVQGEPENASAQTNLGIALLHLGRIPQALAPLEEAVRLAPASVNARINYGVGLLRAGRPVEAEAQFQEALALDPGNEAARANLCLDDGRRRRVLPLTPSP